MSDPIAMVIAAVAAPTAANIGVLVTGLLLGIRHGIDWDHIAAITDITRNTAAAADAGERAHQASQRRRGSAQQPRPWGRRRAVGRTTGAWRARPVPHRPTGDAAHALGKLGSEQRRALGLGTLYALGHGSVVTVLGVRRSSSARCCRSGWIR